VWRRAGTGLAVLRSPGIGNRRALAGRVLARGTPFSHELMEFVQPALHACLAFGVLTVQPFDELMRRLPAVVVGMVAITEQELASSGRILADPPAAWLVAVVLLDELVDAGGDRAQDAELFDIRTEPGPEAVVGAGLVDGARVHLEPVTD